MTTYTDSAELFSGSGSLSVAIMTPPSLAELAAMNANLARLHGFGGGAGLAAACVAAQSMTPAQIATQWANIHNGNIRIK
jgi:hypothetical protein